MVDSCTFADKDNTDKNTVTGCDCEAMILQQMPIAKL
jgi:hypothetical protein